VFNFPIIFHSDVINPIQEVLVKKVLFLPVVAVAAALAASPVSFAGEDDPSPTQAGEVVGQSTPAPAPQKSSSSTRSTKSTKSVARSHSTSSAKATTTVSHSRDTVRARGGVQTGLGGALAASSESNAVLTFGLAGGALALLAAAAGVAPIRRRSEG
jgi:hypothetical protein